jgi:hypothetical protein
LGKQEMHTGTSWKANSSEIKMKDVIKTDLRETRYNGD